MSRRQDPAIWQFILEHVEEASPLRKQIGSTLDYSNAPSSVGYVASQTTVTWQRFQRWRRRMRSARTVSVRASFVSARAS